MIQAYEEEHIDEKIAIEELKADVNDLENYIQDLTSFLPISLCTVNPSNIVIDINNEVTSTIGYKNEELMGNKIHLLFKNQGDAEFLIKNTIDKGFVKNYETIVLTKDKRDMPVNISTALRKDINDGTITGYFIIFTDVTDRKKLEEKLQEKVKTLEENKRAMLNVMEDLQETIALREKAEKELKVSEDRYRTIFENSAVAITFSDEKERVVSWNKYAEDLLGMGKDDLYLKPVKSLYPLEEWKKIRSQDIRQKGMQHHLETKMFRIDKEPIDVDISLSVLKDHAGKIVGSIGVIKDIAKRKKAEIELEKSKRRIELQNIQLRKLDDLKTNFLNVTSHELRTPITPMKGYLQMLLKQKIGDITEEQEKVIKIIQRNTDRLDHLIQDLLDVSRLESGTMKFIPKHADINRLIDETVETMQLSADLKNIKINVDLEEKIPDLIIDQDRIKQIIMNLIDNAIKFSPDNSAINVRAKKEDDNVLFEVQDFGRGIPKDEQTKVFETFYQVDSGMDRKFGGVGLGLSISRGIILAHGGRIWVESTVGKGSTFRFTIPLEPAIDVEGKFKEIDMFGLKDKKLYYTPEFVSTMESKG